MHVDLDPQLEAVIRQKVEAGLYTDAGEVIREALRLLEEREKLQRLRAAVAKGEEGEGIPFTPELIEQMKRDADEMARQGLQPQSQCLSIGWAVALGRPLVRDQMGNWGVGEQS